jgi:hypothetical protein
MSAYVNDDSLCGDCMDGKCHGGEPDDCGCARHAASVEAVNPIDPDDDNLCADGIDYGGGAHCYPGSCSDPEDDAGCEHCGCCACLSCEYARVA